MLIVLCWNHSKRIKLFFLSYLLLDSSQPIQIQRNLFRFLPFLFYLFRAFFLCFLLGACIYHFLDLLYFFIQLISRKLAPFWKCEGPLSSRIFNSDDRAFVNINKFFKFSSFSEKIFIFFT